MDFVLLWQVAENKSDPAAAKNVADQIDQRNKELRDVFTGSGGDRIPPDQKAAAIAESLATMETLTAGNEDLFEADGDIDKQELCNVSFKSKVKE